MTEKHPRTINSIGMFDMLKGAGMLAIVLTHCTEYYAFQTSSGLSVSAFLVYIYRESLMAAFFIASGYGFRKRSIHKCVEQQLKALLKPYILTALCTCVLHFIVHYKAFGYLPGTMGESLKVTGGFLLGLPHTATYAGQEFFSCGPMWFLLSLMLGWVMLDAILNIFPENYTHWAVAGCALLGWGTSLAWELPFCITQGMVIVPYLYIGYIAKRFRLLERRLTAPGKAAIAAAFVLIAVGAIAVGYTDCISMGQWTLGPVSILLDGIAGFALMRLFLRWNRFEGPVVHVLEAIGRRSLNVFCVHTVELIAIPWYLMAAAFIDHPLTGLLLQFALSMASIWAICELLARRRELRAKLLPAQGVKQRTSQPENAAAKPTERHARRTTKH